MNIQRLIILSIILFLLLGALIFVLWQCQKEKIENEAFVLKENSAESLELKDKEVIAGQREGWKIYINIKHSYSFDYPEEYQYAPCKNQPCKNFVYDELAGYSEKDFVIMQGDLSEKGWPNISVSHLSSSFYNPPQGTEIISWLKEKSSNAEYVPSSVNYELGGREAVKVEVPSSPQSYASWVVYFLKEGKLFEIQLTDPSTKEAEDFYNLFLKNFKPSI